MKNMIYLQKAKNSILNRVRFHAPVVFDDFIDRKLLEAYGVDMNLPIFKFDKILNKSLLKAFELAQQEQPFNLLISRSSLGKIKEDKIKIKNSLVYGSSFPVSFFESVNKLNVNYASSSNYNLVFKDKFFKVNGKTLNPRFEDFCLKQFLVEDGSFVDYQEFVLNGSNFLINLQNKEDSKKKVELELNIPLKKGYYFFKRLNKAIMIENLLTKEILYLNYICKNARFSFSDVDGLENSVFSCVNAKLSVNLNENDDTFVFFNLGESKFSLSGLKEIKAFKNIARQKCCEVFNLQIKTKNSKFDYFFNKTLPQKIWINWLNSEIDSDLEEKYLALKRLFIKGTKEVSFVPFKEIGLKELGIFNGEYYKKIIIMRSDEKFLRVGKTFFYNINGVTKRSLTSKEPIMLSFGE